MAGTKRWTRFAVFALALSLVSCAVPTHRGFDQQLSQAHGQDINHVISILGPPARIYNMPNGNTLYTFILSASTYRTPINTRADVYGTPDAAYGQVTTTGGNQVVSYCRVDFVTDAQQEIIASRSQGDRCVAMEQR
jgi:hypothetical protein